MPWPRFTWGQNFVKAIIGNANGAIDSTNPLVVSQASGGAAQTVNQGAAGTQPWKVDDDATQVLLAGGLPAALAANGGLKVEGVAGGVAQPVSAASLPLPTGASTSALQGGGLPAALGAGGGLKVDGSGTALPVSAASLPLPTGGTLVDGTLSATTGAAALGSQACKAVMVQNDPDNTPDIFIGDSSNQRYQLTPGQAIVLPVSNVSQVYGKMASATGNINWLAVL